MITQAAALATAGALTLTPTTLTGAEAGTVKHQPSKGELTVTRDDGTQFLIRAADLRVLCRPTDSKPPVPGILVRTKRSALAADSDGRPSRPLLDIEANRADVRKGLTVTLPSTYAYHDPRGALLFIFDPDGATNGNELNSDGQDSSGSFFIRGRCGKHPKVTLKIEKAVIDSEFHDAPPVTVTGRIVVRG